jgi:hypothetical protein
MPLEALENMAMRLAAIDGRAAAIPNGSQAVAGHMVAISKGHNNSNMN